MAMTLRLTDDEQAALRERADVEGISMQEAARRAVRDYVARGQHRERVSAAAAAGDGRPRRRPPPPRRVSAPGAGARDRRRSGG